MIVFSSDAYVHTPLTFDRDALRLFIQKLNTELFAENGTDLNVAFQLILQKYQTGLSGNSSNANNNRKAKVIVLITDGEDFGELDQNVLFELKKSKINLVILGVGTAQGGGIREGSEFKKDKDGNDILTKLNADYLKNLSKSFGGKYFQLTNQVNDVSVMLKEVDNLESNWIDTRKMTVANNKYYYFVILALILMFVDILVTVRTIKI